MTTHFRTTPPPIKQQAFIAVLALGFMILLYAPCTFVHKREQFRTGDLEVTLNSVYSRLAWQDFVFDKQLVLTYKEKTIKLHYESIEPEVYLYRKAKSIIILDRYSGANAYELTTLRLISAPDCLAVSDACEGFSKDTIAALGKPALVLSGF
ncbi:hypothetical protein [Taibaiella chishuiensis]|uniref:Uncharacterized protein n=1 Tax=Taibaiella chishuiensis TaxID=1434707 RepID=A0A2P8D790_9BACT|nr:hypothetical protein [Taibaiella chishuiensis]PSK93094.1 hypothetical protein B0I18_10263 [Taibaiella chishuiensis]